MYRCLGVFVLIFSIMHGGYFSMCLAGTTAKITNREPRLFGPLAMLRGELLATGDDNPEIVVFWGAHDGDTNIAAWSQSIIVGHRTAGTFSVSAHPLRVGSNYYFRCYALNSAGQSWSPSSTVFRAEGAFDQDAIGLLQESQEAKFLQDMENQGAEKEALALMQEDFTFARSNAVISTWQEYVTEFNVDILEPGLVFDVRENLSDCESSGTNRFHCWLHAWFEREPSNLFSYADSSGSNVLAGAGLTPTNANVGTWMYYTNLTKSTLLFTAEKTWQDSSYKLFFYRREHPFDPTNHFVTFGEVVLKQKDSEWFFTGDMELTRFGRYFFYAGVTSLAMGHYTNVFEVMKESQFPEHFYTIE